MFSYKTLFLSGSALPVIDLLAFGGKGMDSARAIGWLAESLHLVPPGSKMSSLIVLTKHIKKQRKRKPLKIFNLKVPKLKRKFVSMIVKVKVT